MTDKPAKRPRWIEEHIELYLTDPDKAHRWDASSAGGEGLLPTLLLVTSGRQSGEQRLSPLIYQKIGDAFVIIASKGGAPRHPAWYHNLMAQPNCTIHVGSEQYQVCARQAEEPERSDLWQRLAAVYPPYDDYQKKAQARQIPVIVLEPVN